MGKVLKLLIAIPALFLAYFIIRLVLGLIVGTLKFTFGLLLVIFAPLALFLIPIIGIALIVGVFALIFGGIKYSVGR